MKTFSMAIAVPLSIVAYNITMKMDARNIDQLINATVVALVILAVIVPIGLYVLAWLRDRRRMEELSTPRRLPSQPQLWGQPGQQSWNQQPPMLTAQPMPPVGTFSVEQPMVGHYQEDWS